MALSREILRIVQSVPKFRDRLFLLEHLALESQKVNPGPGLVELETVCQWIEETWPHPKRVRHHAARQVARKLRAGALKANELDREAV